jgi:hypothetical protein
MKPSEEWRVRLEETKRRSVLAVLLERGDDILAHLAPLAAREALLLRDFAGDKPESRRGVRTDRPHEARHDACGRGRSVVRELLEVGACSDDLGEGEVLGGDLVAVLDAQLLDLFVR